MVSPAHEPDVAEEALLQQPPIVAGVAVSAATFSSPWPVSPRAAVSRCSSSAVSVAYPAAASASASQPLPRRFSPLWPCPSRGSGRRQARRPRTRPRRRSRCPSVRASPGPRINRECVSGVLISHREVPSSDVEDRTGATAHDPGVQLVHRRIRGSSTLIRGAADLSRLTVVGVCVDRSWAASMGRVRPPGEWNGADPPGNGGGDSGRRRRGP